MWVHFYKSRDTWAESQYFHSAERSLKKEWKEKKGVPDGKKGKLYSQRKKESCHARKDKFDISIWGWINRLIVSSVEDASIRPPNQGSETYLFLSTNKNEFSQLFSQMAQTPCDGAGDSARRSQRDRCSLVLTCQGIPYKCGNSVIRFLPQAPPNNRG